MRVASRASLPEAEHLKGNTAMTAPNAAQKVAEDYVRAWTGRDVDKGAEPPRRQRRV